MTAPNVLYDQPHDVYLSDESAVSVSGLCAFARSPRHHWYECRRPDRVPDPPTPAQKFGTAVHMAVLEFDRFRQHYAVAPAVKRTTKVGKRSYQAFLDNSQGREPIKRDDFISVCRIADAVRQHPCARELMGRGKAEVSVYWTDEETGVRCRMRPDFVCDGESALVDLKSTTDASFETFTRTAYRLNYYVTAAFYLDGWKAATGEDREYIFGVWEVDAPYESMWYYAAPDLIDAGREKYRSLLRKYAECLKTDKWPGYETSLVPLQMPVWASSI